MMDTTNYVVELRDYATRTRSELRYVDLGFVGPDHDPTFTQRAVLNGKAYPDGVGKNKKDAKRNAAKNAIRCLFENEHEDTADLAAGENEELNLCTRIRPLAVNSMLHRSKQKQSETNYIGLVAHYCQRTNRYHSYIEERRCGTPHNPRFFYKLMIDKKEYPEGEGKTVKEARQNAARLAWYALQEQSDWDSKVSIRSAVSEDGTTSMSVESPTQESLVPSSQIAVSSIPPKVQMSVRLEDDASTKLSAPNSLESLASSQSMSAGTSGSELFTESSNSSNNQDDVVKHKNGNNENEICSPSRFTSDFDIMECLGSGAFGCVYKVKHKLLKKHYAVKIVRCGKNSLREVGTLSDLLHHNIIRYYTFWVEDTGHQWNISADSCGSSSKSNNSSAKYLYIQMELCDPKTLKVWIDEKNTQSLQDSKRRQESLKIAQQIVGGVEYIHSQKHVHRDLKPENILFGLDGQVKIGDFGLVTSDYDNDDSALMERTGDRGTTTYMAPEQKTETTYDRKVDIFALGLIYFELLWKLSTGHERVVVWDDARSQKFPKEFSLTFPQEDQIIKSMLCEKPEDRPEANTLKAELEKWKF